MMRARAGQLAGLCVATFALAACNPTGDVGYVEIKTIPVSSVSAPSLYLDHVKLEPLKKGVAVLRQRVGTARLATDGGSGELYMLCDIAVKKNRITSVTISVLERPPRCQCRASSGKDSHSRVCVS